VELRGRLPVLVALGLVLALAPPARAQVFLTQPEALAQAFPGARVERRTWTLTPAQKTAVEQRAKGRCANPLVVAYLAWQGTALSGTGFFDARTVRTMPGVFFIAVGPDSAIRRVDVLAFREPPDYRPTPRWLGQFPRQRLGDRLAAGRDIRTLSGASLTTRAVTDAARLALAEYELVVAPALAATPAPPSPAGAR
jgi:hypothetical protein